MRLIDTLNASPKAKTLNRITVYQKNILRLLEEHAGSLIVHGVYMGDVFSLQAQGLVTSRHLDSGQMEVQLGAHRSTQLDGKDGE